MLKVHSLAGMAGTPLLSEGLLVLLGCVGPVLTKYTYRHEHSNTYITGL